MITVVSIIGIIITILFVIGTHEAAHFMAARALSVKVLTFSIGFGKTLFRCHDKRGTEYIFALIPLGGYVKMLDEGEGNVAPNERHMAYNRQPFYKKFIIVSAGPLMNIFCALILYWIVFMVGFTTFKPIIGEVAPNSIAAKANLKPQQEIISLDNRPISSWLNVVFRLLVNIGDHKEVQIETLTPLQTTPTQHTLDLSQWEVDELRPDPLKSLGITPFLPVFPMIIGTISPDSPASHSKLLLGDLIIALNHQKVTNWQDVRHFVLERPNQEIAITVLRQNKLETLTVKIGAKTSFFAKPEGVLGIGPKFTLPKELLRHVQYAPLPALNRAWHEIGDFTYFNFILFGKLITGKLSLQSLGGPITIFETAGDALNSGLLAFLSFLAFLSISIGIINILPIPGLDGGHLLFQLIETIIRRPIPERYLLLLYRLGFIFILLIMFQAIVNDLFRLYN